MDIFISEKKNGPDLKKITIQVCEQCGKKFPTQRSLRQHLQLHSSEPQHKCEGCGHTFQFQQSYIRHCKNKSCGYKRNRKSNSGPKKNNVYWGQVSSTECDNEQIVFVEVEDSANVRSSNDPEGDSDDSINYFDISHLPNNEAKTSESANPANSDRGHQTKCFVIGVTQDQDGKLVATSTTVGNVGELCKSSGNSKPFLSNILAKVLSKDSSKGTSEVRGYGSNEKGQVNSQGEDTELVNQSSGSDVAYKSDGISSALYSTTKTQTPMSSTKNAVMLPNVNPFISVSTAPRSSDANTSPSDANTSPSDANTSPSDVPSQMLIANSSKMQYSTGWRYSTAIDCDIGSDTLLKESMQKDCTPRHEQLKDSMGNLSVPVSLCNKTKSDLETERAKSNQDQGYSCVTLPSCQSFSSSCQNKEVSITSNIQVTVADDGNTSLYNHLPSTHQASDQMEIHIETDGTPELLPDHCYGQYEITVVNCPE